MGVIQKYPTVSLFLVWVGNRWFWVCELSKFYGSVKIILDSRMLDEIKKLEEEIQIKSSQMQQVKTVKTVEKVQDTKEPKPRKDRVNYQADGGCSKGSSYTGV